MIYFDNAATSFPKPEAVIDAVSAALRHYAANPGRGSHFLSEKAMEVITEAREEIAHFFGLYDKNRVFFYQNATMALNQAIKGFPFKKGDHVITSSYEHNSIRRPLEAVAREKDLNITYLSLDTDGHFDEEVWREALQRQTKLIAVTHGSNLTGMVLPIKEIGQLAIENDIPILLDASQTAGSIPIHMDEMNIDLLAFPGHKGLLGPQGTGALLVRKGIELKPLIHGGTGSLSEEINQPSVLPDKYESGTLNTAGIAGLLAGIREVKKMTIAKVNQHELELASYCYDQLRSINRVRIYGPSPMKRKLGIIAFEITGNDCQEIATILDLHYGIAVRAGLHCAPLAHDSLGTTDRGLIRVSFGFQNTIEEIDQFINAIKEIVQFYPENNE